METAIEILQKAGSEIKCNTLRAQIAFNLVVDSILYLQGHQPVGYYKPDRYASQLFGEKDDSREEETAVDGTGDVDQQENRKAQSVSGNS